MPLGPRGNRGLALSRTAFSLEAPAVWTPAITSFSTTSLQKLSEEASDEGGESPCHPVSSLAVSANDTVVTGNFKQTPRDPQCPTKVTDHKGKHVAASRG